MVKKHIKDLIVGLDIGTSKITAIVGEARSDGQIQILGVGTYPSKGLKRGVVVNIDATVNSIQYAVEEAESRSGYPIRSVYTGIAGNHIRSLNSHGIVAIQNQEVGQIDVDRVIEAARAVAIPADQKILHILPQEFIIDNQDGIHEPIGMAGVRLEAKVHMVTGAVSAAQNIVKCVQRCGLEVTDMILEQLASSYSVLTEDEKELGVCLVDIGGGTTDIAIFTEGSIRHTAVIPIAGDQVTNDIAIALRTPTQCAEEIKIKHACISLETEHADELIDILSVVGERPRRQITKRALVEVIEPRYRELFSLIKSEIRRSGLEELIVAGIVLTGGASNIKGCIELGESVFKVPVRLGLPQNVLGLPEIVNNGSYATGIGLLIYGQQQYQSGGYTSAFNFSVIGMLAQLKKWFTANF